MGKHVRQANGTKYPASPLKAYWPSCNPKSLIAVTSHESVFFVVPFLVGLLGFVAMVALGSLRGGHSGGHAHTGGHSLGHGQAHALGHGHAAAHGQPHSLARPSGQSPMARGGHARGLRVREAGDGSTPFATALGTLCPVNIFGLFLGFGATGMIFGTLLGFQALVIASCVGALVFTFGMVKPLMNWLAGFATQPSVGLEGMIFQEAEAITGFDAEGRGIVRLTLDGQHVQLLATLDLLEVEKGVQVRKGEKLIVTEVDSVKNSCRVTRELAI